ncbi:MAG: CARDB domain-containing protein [Acidobacteriota bacterium]
MEGLVLCCSIPPQIRRAVINPWVEDYLDAVYEYRQSQELEFYDDEIREFRRRYKRYMETLGPLSVPPGSFAHWDVFLSDVERAGTLGWVSDAALFAGIRENLQAARQAALQGNLSEVNAKLDLVAGAAEGASSSQMRREAKDLIVLNARYLKAHLPWPCEPKLTLEPTRALHPVGETATVTARLVNTATGLPIANNALTVEVVEGPHGGTKREETTDAEGKVVLSYIGTRLGTDRIQAHTPFGTIAAGSEKEASKATASRPKAGTAEDCTAWDLEQGPVTVKWEGGPDLAVPLFVPPVLRSGPGQTFYVTERTKNLGNLPSGPSVTRYVLSATKPVDPASALVVGQRSVAALAPGEESGVFEAPFTVPQDLSPGTYYLDACADADGAVIETKEDNNCASARVNLFVGVMPANRPPECAGASASASLLWPPNHKPQDIALQGVTDPDGDPVTVTVSAITQDEPTNGLGDGDEAPDGFGVGTATARVRAERSGTGNGRVYRIAFTASDGKGGSCQGSVTVGAPHDIKDAPIDDGQAYDSTK